MIGLNCGWNRLTSYRQPTKRADARDERNAGDVPLQWINERGVIEEKNAKMNN